MLPVGFLLAAAFVLGVALEGTDLFVIAAMTIAGLAIVAWVFTERAQTLFVGALAVLVFLGGAARVSGDDPFPVAPDALESAESFSGRVSGVPRRYSHSTQARITIQDPAPAQVWGDLPPYPEVQQGDIVDLRGGFRPFDERNHRGFAAQRGTSGILTAGDVSPRGNDATAAQRFRNTVTSEVRSRLQQRIPEPAGAFTTGVLLGDDGAMTEATRDAFRVGGMTHMTAVSGIHVGIIAGAVLLLGRLGLVHRWWLLGVCIPLIWTFAYVAGMRPSVTRASLMLTLFFVAQLLGRPRDTLNAVGLAAALMILVNPEIRHDIGFQLSVAATAGIAVGVLLIGNRSPWHVVWVVPLAAEIAVEPLILYHFGYYSLVSPFANIIAAPFLAATMATGIITVLVSLVSGMLADAMAIATWVPARAVVLIADTAAGVPLLSGDVEPISLSGVWIAYVVICGFCALLFVLLRPDLAEADGDAGVLYRV